MMQMAAGRWDLLASQISWLANDPGENPFVIKPAVKTVQMSAGDIARMLFGKVQQ